jgi:competence protein ComEA
VSAENTVENDVTNNEQKYNINKISDDEMKLLGLTKKEIKDIKILREKGEIRSNIDLKEIFSEKRYSEIERSIEFEGE